MFGHILENSKGKKIPVRYICEQHIMEDCGGFIPSVSDWFRNIKQEGWMSRGYRIDTASKELSETLPKPQVKRRSFHP